MKEEGLKIVSATIENFKNIDAKEITLDGKSMVIIGKNGSGKSSLIQALLSPLNSKMIPQKPIKDGEERSTIEVEIAGNLDGTPVKYFIDCYFTAANQKGRIVLRDEEGNESKGAKNLVKSIVGDVGFDILDFLSLAKTNEGKLSKSGVAKQIEILRSILPKETKIALDENDKQYTELFSERTLKNREIDNLSSFLNNNEYSQDEIDEYSEKKDPKPLQEKLGKLSEEISKYDKVADKIKSLEDESTGIKNLEEQIEILKNTLAEKEGKLAEDKEVLAKSKKWIEGKERPSAEGINGELEKINEHNLHCDKISEFVDKSKELNKAKQDSEKITEDLAELKENKKELFSSGDMPVPGLIFEDDQIFYKNQKTGEELPLRDDQIPSSTIIAIGVKIAMAMNPNLRVLTIKDGSLLDKNTLKTLLKICDRYNYQVLIEMVSFDGDDLEVEFAEKFVE